MKISNEASITFAQLEREIANTANEIDQLFRQQHTIKDLEHILMRLINRTHNLPFQTSSQK